MSRCQEKAILNSTLACLVKTLQNKRTTVELRNESFVTGKIVQSDGFMNITMEDVLFTDAHGNKAKFDSFFVQNRLIRFVQIPKHLDIKKELKTYTEGLGAGRGRGRGIKQCLDIKTQRNHEGRGEISRGRLKILEGRELRRQEDIANALKMKEEWKREKELKMKS